MVLVVGASFAASEWHPIGCYRQDLIVCSFEKQFVGDECAGQSRQLWSFCQCSRKKAESSKEWVISKAKSKGTAEAGVSLGHRCSRHVAMLMFADVFEGSPKGLSAIRALRTMLVGEMPRSFLPAVLVHIHFPIQYRPIQLL